ncbi:MAG: hypothetical protein FDW93_04550 [Bergeyella sp.]|nr:hypothetical protein [Bergeyella sp.]
MISNRTIALLRNSDLLTLEDIHLLKKEISRYPYVQSIRALLLFGAHKFNLEEYKTLLASTAAYTTDKKILYQFINGHKKGEKKSSVISQGEETDTELLEIYPEQEKEISEETPREESKSEEGDSFSLSYFDSEEFLPEVNISSPKPPPEIFAPLSPINPSVSSHYKYEDEMKRLIAEVEAKMNASKKETVVHKEKEAAAGSAGKDVELEVLLASPSEIKIESPEKEPLTEEKTELPILDTEENSVAEKEKKQLKEQRPVLNVSFFSDSLRPIETKTDGENVLSEKEEVSKAEEKTSFTGSNVPQFVNTWKNWLHVGKADKKNLSPSYNFGEEEDAESREVLKKKAIESFIESNPKISKLKKDSEFVVKEKKDDISHLMTETFARLYFDQKLYSKTIKAYQILKKKHPEKEKYFEEKIRKVKEARQETGKR